MSREVVCLILYYDGKLKVDDQFAPFYEGGKNRPIQVLKSSTFEGLQMKVMKTLKLDLTAVRVKLVCRLPIAGGFVASHMVDDEVCETVLTMAAQQPIVVYVEVEHHQMPSFVAESSRRLSSVEGVALTDVDQFLRRSDEQITREYLVNLSSQPSQGGITTVHDQVENESITAPVETNTDGYETMQSGSSSESDDSDNGDDSIINTFKGHEFIKKYSSGTANVENKMISSNDFVLNYETTREWDAEVTFDGPSEGNNMISGASIPDEIYEGMCFSEKKELQFAVHGWSIINNVEFQIYSSNRKKFTIMCVHHNNHSRPCSWRLHAACSKRLGNAWIVSTMGGQHTCINPVMRSGHRQCNAKFISFFILPMIRQQIDLKPREIIGRIEAKFNIKVSYMKAWDARRKAIKVIFGGWEESYRSLNRLMEGICSVMPGTVYRTNCSESYRFQRIFWSFGPSITGWSYCRPVLSMDGTFLLGKYRGTLLTAVGIDANNGLFPLAFAIVESERNESWDWFLRALHDLIPSISARKDLCIISDRHSGLIRGCNEIFPWAAHRHCLRHLRENFKKAIRSMGICDAEFLCQKMYVAGNTDSLHTFTRHMSDIKNVKFEAFEWLEKRDFAKWALTHDGGFRYGTMTTNASECFNGVLKRARGLPIQALIGSIYYNLINIFLKRSAIAKKTEAVRNFPYVSRTKSLLESYEQEARCFPEPIRINAHEFQVFDMACRSFKVDISRDGCCSCTCQKPRLYHVPCPHVIAAAGVQHRSHYSFISNYYSMQNYISTYQSEFHVIPEKSAWPPFDVTNGIFELTPPYIRRKSGRPRTSRFKNTMDETRAQSSKVCGICKNVGHNRSTCPLNLEKTRNDGRRGHRSG